MSAVSLGRAVLGQLNTSTSFLSDQRGVMEPIQGLWIGDRLSTMERLSIASFLYHGHPFHLYTYDRVADVPDGATLFDANEIVCASQIFTYPPGLGEGSFAGFADLFRYKLLSKRGGWWVDLDTVALRPFDFDREHVLGLQDRGSVAGGVIRAPVGSPLMVRSYEEARRAGHEIVWGQIGPRLLTRLVVECGLFSALEPPISFYPVPWKKWRRLVEPGARLPRASFAVHLWRQMWQWAGLRADDSHPPDSVFEKLKNRYLERA